MELTQQHVLPHVINLLLRVLVLTALAEAVLDCRQRSKILQVPEQDLALPVVALVVRLRRVGAAVELKVQLAVPSDELSAVLDLLL